MSMLFDTLYMFNQRPLQMALWKRSASPLKKHICKVNKCSWSQIQMNSKKAWVACKWPLQSISSLEHWDIFQHRSGLFGGELYFQVFLGTNYKRLALWFNSNVITLSPQQFKLSLALSSCIRFWFKKLLLDLNAGSTRQWDISHTAALPSATHLSKRKKLWAGDLQRWCDDPI